MTIRRGRFALVVFISLTVCGCSAATDFDEPPAPAGGTIELAVSETCTAGSDPQCTPVGDEYVMRPVAFEKATVEEAVVSEGPQQNAIDVTFTSEGAAVLSDLTDRASQSGSESRLLVKIGDEIVAAVVVKEALDGDEVTIGLAPEDDPQEVIDLLHGT